MCGQAGGRGRLQGPPRFLHLSLKGFVSPETAPAQRRAGLRESCSGDGFLKQIRGKWREVRVVAEAFASLRPAPAAAHPLLSQQQHRRQQRPAAAPWPEAPHAEGAAAAGGGGGAAASLVTHCTDSQGFNGPREAPHSRASGRLSRSLTRAPARLLLGRGMRCLGVFMIYFIFDLILTLCHPVLCTSRPRPPPPGIPPRSGRGRTPLFGFKRSSGRGRARPVVPDSRLPAAAPAPPWWCRRGALRRST